MGFDFSTYLYVLAHCVFSQRTERYEGKSTRGFVLYRTQHLSVAFIAVGDEIRAICFKYVNDTQHI